MSVGAVNKQTGERIPTAGMPAIDDALDLTSVNPVQNAIVTAALANKQNATDNNLQTTDKTVVGAINEHDGDIDSLKSGLTNVADDVKLNTQDLTTPSRTKNLLKIQSESQTIAGIIYTVNDDGTITANGTASGNSIVAIYFSNNDDLNKNYIVSGCPSGGGINLYKLQVFANDASEIIAQDIGDGVSFNTNKPFSIRIVIYSGITVSNLVFKPMLRLLSETDPTFAPYIPSVESRIEAVENNAEHIIETVAINAYSKYSDALAHLYTTYNALSDNIKRRCYIKVNDYYIMRNSALNYGQFSRCFLLVNGSNVGTGIEVMALANNVFLRTSLYNDTTTADFSAQAQTAKLDLCYS